MRTNNRDHWQRIGADYAEEWTSPAKRALNSRELALVARGLRDSPGRTALDVGIGNGRILAELLRARDETLISGIDVAPAMVDACARRFAGEPRIAQLSVCDVAYEPLPFDGPFDFVSAIRMLKYSLDWRGIVAKLVAPLGRDGLIAFSMPNRDSLNRLSRPYAVRWHASSVRELKLLCEDLDLELLELRGFARLPHTAYNRARSAPAAGVVVAADLALEGVLGQRRLARELFVLARRR